MNRNAIVFSAVFFLMLLSGCHSAKKALNQYEREISLGMYPQAAEHANAKAEKNNGDRLMWKLLCANANSIQGLSQKAIEDFDIAEDIFQENDRKSVFLKGTNVAWAMMTNDAAFPFNGNGQERIFCCLYKALDYAALGNTNAARTEFNRAGDHQENWLFERRKDIASARERMNKDAAEMAREKKIPQENNTQTVHTAMANDTFRVMLHEKCDYSPNAISDNLDNVPESQYCNAYLSYLTGIFRWLNGDGGRNFLRDAHRWNPTNTVIAQDLSACEQGTKPQNHVWIFVEDGLCPCREECKLNMPIFLIPYARRYVIYTGMALPFLRYRPNGASSYSVQAGENKLPFEKLENMDKLIKTEYDVYMKGALEREITRVILRAGTQAVLGIAADHTRDSDAKFSLRMAQFAAAAWAASTTGADLRSWSSLPKTILTQRIQRPSDGKITIWADAKSSPMQLPQGNCIIWIRKTSPLTNMVTKIISIPAPSKNFFHH